MLTVHKVKYRIMNGVIPYCVLWDRLDPLFFTKGWLKPDRMYKAATEACLKITNCNHAYFHYPNCLSVGSCQGNAVV